MFALMLSFSVLLAADAPHKPDMEHDDIEWHGDFGFFRGYPDVWVYRGDSKPDIKLRWGAYSHDLGKATSPPNGPLSGGREGEKCDTSDLVLSQPPRLQYRQCRTVVFSSTWRQSRWQRHGCKSYR
jgi:hypothetical protein